MTKIVYRDGYEYQLVEDYTVPTGVRPGVSVSNRFIRLDFDGTLTIRADYAWDGPSGPAIDTKNFMRGSLVHDALYQLMREGYLDPDQWRDPADRELQRICLQDGMSSMRAWWVYQGVRLGGGPAADPKRARKPTRAP